VGEEFVTVSVGGMVYSAFKHFGASAAFNEASRDFLIEVACELGASATNRVFRVGAEVTISSNGSLMVKGFVDRRQPRIEAKKAIIRVSGRSKSGDLVDSSGKHDTGRFKNKTALEIGNEIAQGIAAQFETDQQLEKIEQYQLTPGESVFRAVEKLTRQQGLTITGTPEGNAKITKAGSQRHAGMLYEGENSDGGNLLSGESDHNNSNRHSEYTVRGQRPFGHGADNLEIQAIARDKGVDRYRPIIIIQDEDTTKKRAQKRAKTRRDRAAGHSLKATIEVQGFRDQGGTLWTPGWLIYTQSSTLDIAQDMLIEKVAWKQDENGSISTLSLTDPQAYDGKAGKGGKSGSDWSMDSSEAE
jgi:prophage tail gpP-like protein